MLSASNLIGRVRIRSDSRDRTSLKIRCEAVFRAVDLTPATMPPQAILCIRSLNDPLPGTIDLHSSHITQPAAWEYAARDSVTAAYRRAARHAHCSVPSSADAVLFADHAELLACAARDACNGLLNAWWWKHIIPSFSFDRVVAEWKKEPLYVPAAVDLLCASGDAISFIGRIERKAAIELTALILRAHHAEAAARAVADLFTGGTPRSERPQARASEFFPAARSWRRTIMPELEHAPLTVEQRIFATTALILRRKPHIAAAPSIAGKIAEWLSNTMVADDTIVQPEVPHNDTTPERTLQQPVPSALPVEKESGSVVGRRAQRVRPRSSHGFVLLKSQSSDQQHAPDRSDEMSSVVAPVSPQRDQATTEYDAISVIPKTQARPPLHPVPHLFEAAIDSDHAGIFFLLNAAIALGYYGDAFRQPESPLELSPWDFLAIASRAISAEIEDDALWDLLAQLANREEPLRSDFVPPEELNFDERLRAMREHLSLALAIESADAFLIRRRGSILITPAHIDISFPLLSHSIEIRMAGLDRDPGWIPAAGRYVTFHFD